MHAARRALITLLTGAQRLAGARNLLVLISGATLHYGTSLSLVCLALGGQTLRRHPTTSRFQEILQYLHKADKRRRLALNVNRVKVA